MPARTIETTRADRLGFTLVELVLVIIITGVIAAIAMPRFTQATARQQLDAAANRLVSDLEKAQYLSRASSNDVVVSFDTTANSYNVTAAFGSAFEVQLDDSPYQVSISTASFDTLTAVTFNGFGIPSSSGIVSLDSATDSVIINLGANGRATR